MAKLFAFRHLRNFNLKNLIQTRSIVLTFILLLLVWECRPASARSLKQRRSKKSVIKDLEESSDGFISPGGDTDLIGLIEERLGKDLNEFNDNFVLNRMARSPLDDEIDDVTDSNEDDSDEEKDDEDTPNTDGKKPLNSTTAHMNNTGGVTQQVSKPTPSTVAIPLITTAKPPETTLKLQAEAGGVGRSLPAPPRPQPSNTNINVNGSQPARPPFPGPPPQFGGGRPPPPGFKLPPGAVPFPGKPGPGGALPFPGKLPPNLLKHIPTPPPPAKKGELHLPEDYNNLVIPKLNLGKLIGIDSFSAVPVLVFLNIRSVRDIDETQETLTLDLDLVIEWVDGHLFDPISAVTSKQPDITLNPIFLKKIWRPDVYIDEIVKVKRTSLMNKPLKLKFNPSNGFISYTTRLTVQLSCDMIYFYYPADTHRCAFTFRSYSYFGKDMELSWLGTGVYLQDPYDPNFDLQVESIDRIKLPQTFRKLTNDTYDGLRFTILARRKLSFHMVQTYLPSIFFIVITWLCFLVPARMVEARIGISMTTLLTLTSMFASVRESTPIVSYVKAIDIWMVFCIFFVFLTLLEFATFVWLRARREDAEEMKLEQRRKAQEKAAPGKKDLEATFTRRGSAESIQLRKYESAAEFTEKYAFVIFSIVFILFNIFYWSWLLAASNYFDWHVNSTLNADLDD